MDQVIFKQGGKRITLQTILNRRTHGWAFRRDGHEMRARAQAQILSDYASMSLSDFKAKYSIFIY